MIIIVIVERRTNLEGKILALVSIITFSIPNKSLILKQLSTETQAFHYQNCSNQGPMFSRKTLRLKFEDKNQNDFCKKKKNFELIVEIILFEIHFERKKNKNLEAPPTLNPKHSIKFLHSILN